MIIISLDTETTGLDLRHGCKPYLITITYQDGQQVWCEWDVNPLTRMPTVDPEDVRAIQAVIDEADFVVMQNPKFDVRACEVVGIKIPWEKVYDTLLASHLLASSEPHDLATLALLYLNVDILPLEEEIHKLTNKVRNRVKRQFPKWRTAEAGDPMLPSGAGWKADMWLPRAFAKRVKMAPSHRYWKALPEYANGDSAVTLPLWVELRKALEERGLWELYLRRRQVLPVTYKMETVGVTFSQARTKELRTTYIAESEEAGRVCMEASEGQLTRIPGSTSNELKHLLFNHWKLPTIAHTKKGNPSTTSKVMKVWASDYCEEGSNAQIFCSNLPAKRSRDTAVQYMDGYLRSCCKIPKRRGQLQLYLRMYPTLNITGTHTLRFTSNNPNEQNISKKEGFNLRYIFGPAPGREWWSIDFNNIELRLPAYEANEAEMIRLFEKPDEAPYFGSYHLLVCHVLHPRKFEKCLKDGVSFKDRYKSTWYQWTKNGNFAVQYGAIESSGTADAAYHVKGGQAKIQKRFKNIAKLNQRMIEMANDLGYVTTIPSNGLPGYPLQCPATENGSVKPTVPLNYHIQGTAMWCMTESMVRVQDYLDRVNSQTGEDYVIVMQIHDELVFDFPRKADLGNLPKIRKIKRLMEQSGRDISIPLPVSVGYHPVSWDKELSIAL